MFTVTCCRFPPEQNYSHTAALPFADKQEKQETQEMTRQTHQDFRGYLQHQVEIQNVKDHVSTA